jgi:hypothetical protein
MRGDRNLGGSVLFVRHVPAAMLRALDRYVRACRREPGRARWSRSDAVREILSEFLATLTRKPVRRAKG